MAISRCGRSRDIPDGPGQPAAFTAKPSWSVLSLPDLNEAIRQVHDPARLRAEETRQIERQKVRASRARDDRAANTARAERDRYRNAWEHSD